MLHTQFHFNYIHELFRNEINPAQIVLGKSLIINQVTDKDTKVTSIKGNRGNNNNSSPIFE